MNDTLCAVVERSRRRVPFYRERLAAWDCTPPGAFDRQPRISKQEIAGQEHRLLADGTDATSVLEETTSGSSGTPLRCFKSKRERLELAMRLWRLRAEYGGITPGDRTAEFYGFIQEGSRFRTGETEIDGRSLCLSMLNLSPAALGRYYQALCAYQASWFFSVPSALSVLADYMLDHGLSGQATGIRYIETTGEVLFGHQKQRIEAAFGCRVFNHYGCREFWLLAMSCPKGNLHLEQDHIHAEVLPVPDEPGMGELVVTALRNDVWPLIRYRVGDRVQPGFGTCPCGRPGPILTSLSGRATELLLIGPWTANTILFFYAVTQVNSLHPDAIRQFRVVQPAETELLFQYVPGSGISAEARTLAIATLVSKLPPETRIELEPVAVVPITGRKHSYFVPCEQEEKRCDQPI